jgi:molecular chaperone GrpE
MPTKPRRLCAPFEYSSDYEDLAMTDPNSDTHIGGPDEKTAVLPETAVALVELERLQQELAASEERAKNHWEQYLRALADVDNVRKRGAKDLESARQFAVERFAQDLIGVKDSLELGIANSAKAADVASLVEGQNATLRLLAKAFEKAQIEEVNPEGKAFNPELHEAMMAQPSEAAPNTVIAVVQRGYTLNGRLLRPARVIVSAPKN